VSKTSNFVFLGALALSAAGCSGGTETNSNRTPTSTNTATTNTTTTTTTASDAAHTTATSADVPANVRAVFTDAQTFTMQHKDLSASQVSSVEKETNTKIAETDHHSYLAFSAAGGTRRQIGAATVVKAGGKEMIVVYESRNGVPYIKEVRAEGVPESFLIQFKGMGHDNKFIIGQDLKADGTDVAIARAAAEAIRQDSAIMQILYGGEHSH